jgi:hypothetical protein
LQAPGIARNIDTHSIHLLQKTDFARSQCLGGVMVWAISHDIMDAKFSHMLSKAIRCKVVALTLSVEDPDNSMVRTVHSQYKQTSYFYPYPKWLVTYSTEQCCDNKANKQWARDR